MSQNIPQFTVAEFSKAIKLTVENAFGYVKISGEITGLKKASSGHLYFNLKEENSLLTAVCFRNQAKNIDFEIGDGLQICAYGQITVYEGRSNYQIIVDKIEIAGIGAILEMIEKRRQKLASEGLFDEVYKKPIPFFPRIVGVITSETGAVIEDIKHRIQDRCPLNLLLYPSAVQGDKAPVEIISGIRYFNALKHNRPEVIIIARGGGSFEDLLAFNDENLVREVFKSEIPIISAVGHETDFTLIDFVADLRAPTPTASAEFVTPVLAELKQNLNNIIRNIDNSKENYFKNKLQEIFNLSKNIISPQKYLENIENKYISLFEKIHILTFNILENQTQRTSRIKIEAHQVFEKIENYKQKLNFNFERIFKFIENDFAKKFIVIEGLAKSIKSSNYHQILARGFAVVKDVNNQPIANCIDLKKHANFIIEMHDGALKGANLNLIETRSFDVQKKLISKNQNKQNQSKNEHLQSSIFDLIDK